MKVNLSCNSFYSYIPNFLDLKEQSQIIQLAKEEAQWRHDKIEMFGKVHDQPRKVAFFGDEEIAYTYSKIKMQTQGWSEGSLFLRDKVKEQTNILFNTCILNLYRNGDDYMSWHSDNEPELGSKPIVVSVSIGEEREFFFRSKNDKNTKHKIKLESGSLLFMGGDIQNEFHHALPKRKKQNNERLNFTFRSVRFA